MFYKEEINQRLYFLLIYSNKEYCMQLYCKNLNIISIEFMIVFKILNIISKKFHSYLYNFL